MSVYSASPLYIPRIRRVSSPELARELAGPQASTSVTRAPRPTSESAAHPPNAPAPTTITRADGDDMRLSALQPFLLPRDFRLPEWARRGTRACANRWRRVRVCGAPPGRGTGRYRRGAGRVKRGRQTGPLT